MNYAYCPQCGKKGSVVEENQTHSRCSNCGTDFWNNPRAAMSVLFINDKGELLFGKRAFEPEKGKYDFPGGFVEYNEDLFDAAVREVEEETGILIDKRDLELITTYTLEYMPGVSAIDLILVAKKWEGRFKASDDVAELEWKPLSFIYDEAFRPAYPGLEAKISRYLPS
ncbi:MAG TPA: NUDIX domain-containing protein [Candidatus Saccharimonadales bacterium]|nr:NUDIX domain-containing protein [Candidatus Saccharimonadales bacterium]